MSSTRRKLWVLALGIATAWGSGAARAETLTDDATQIGANTFYSFGYTGTRALVGVVDAGMAWTGQQSLNGGNVIDQTDPFATAGGVADHATRCTGTIAAKSISTGGPGIAYGATVWSTGISTADNGNGNFSITGDSLAWALMVFGQTGINGSGQAGGTGSKTVDVISTSWGEVDNTANSVTNVIYDYLATHGVTMVCAAGNGGQGPGTVTVPANGWNVIAVGATTGSGASEQVANFSSGGKVGSFSFPATRTKPDMVAPGVNIELPTYDTGNPSEFAVSSGTSFSTPTVAGAAALLVDVGKATNRGTDPRVMKVVLMNSARKLAGWSQVTGVNPTTGTVVASTPLDPYQGTGTLDLAQAWNQYTASAGQTGSGPGTVGGTGWSLSTVAQGAPVNYVMNNSIHTGDEIEATLTWFMQRTASGFNANSSDPFATMSFTDDKFDDLDLYLYKVDSNGNAVGNAVAASISGWDINNPNAPGTGWDSVEHIDFAAPTDGRYMLEVVWTQQLFNNIGAPHSDEFAVAWSETPEPGTMVLIGMGVAVLIRRSRNSKL